MAMMGPLEKGRALDDSTSISFSPPIFSILDSIHIYSSLPLSQTVRIYISIIFQCDITVNWQEVMANCNAFLRWSLNRRAIGIYCNSFYAAYGPVSIGAGIGVTGGPNLMHACESGMPSVERAVYIAKAEHERFLLLHDFFLNKVFLSSSSLPPCCNLLLYFDILF